VLPSGKVTVKVFWPVRPPVQSPYHENRLAAKTTRENRLRFKTVDYENRRGTTRWSHFITVISPFRGVGNVSNNYTSVFSYGSFLWRAARRIIFCLPRAHTKSVRNTVFIIVQHIFFYPNWFTRVLYKYLKYVVLSNPTARYHTTVVLRPLYVILRVLFFVNVSTIRCYFISRINICFSFLFFSVKLCISV